MQRLSKPSLREASRWKPARTRAIWQSVHRFVINLATDVPPDPAPRCAQGRTVEVAPNPLVAGNKMELLARLVRCCLPVGRSPHRVEDEAIAEAIAMSNAIQ